MVFFLMLYGSCMVFVSVSEIFIFSLSCPNLSIIPETPVFADRITVVLVSTAL